MQSTKIFSYYSAAIIGTSLALTMPTTANITCPNVVYNKDYQPGETIDGWTVYKNEYKSKPGTTLNWIFHDAWLYEPGHGSDNAYTAKCDYKDKNAEPNDVQLQLGRQDMSASTYKISLSYPYDLKHHGYHCKGSSLAPDGCQFIKLNMGMQLTGVTPKY